jgi:hypothetical protein
MKTTTENLKELFTSGLHFEEITFQLYVLWCDSVTVTAREFQQVLANAKVANWFRTELYKNETEYLFLIQNYKELPLEDRTELYIRCVFNLFSVFPQPLLVEAKQRDTKPQRSECSIINQN